MPAHAKWDTGRGKWTIKRILKSIIQANGGEMPVEDLLNKMNQRGYLKEPLRQRLEALDVDVVDGKVRLRG
ncbi:unnamed protein product [marine sediment metagenome]|uniref:Uncharacterized protein n=1 Tax=marine sediment metagenome TaxID=412755 RepID=X1AIS5_9ZZZZ